MKTSLIVLLASSYQAVPIPSTHKETWKEHVLELFHPVVAAMASSVSALTTMKAMENLKSPALTSIISAGVGAAAFIEANHVMDRIETNWINPGKKNQKKQIQSGMISSQNQQVAVSNQIQQQPASTVNAIG